MYRKSSINSLPGSYLFQIDLGGGELNRDEGLFWDRGLFNLAKIMVSVLHKELEYKVEKVKYKKL